MFVDVPEPVWKTSIGNWSSCLPSATSSPARAIRSASLPVEQPELRVHARGLGLDAPEPADDGRRDALAGHGKFSTAFTVRPHSSRSAVAGDPSESTAISPSSASVTAGCRCRGAVPLRFLRKLRVQIRAFSAARAPEESRVLIAGVTALIRIDRSWTPTGGGGPGLSDSARAWAPERGAARAARTA